MFQAKMIILVMSQKLTCYKQFSALVFLLMSSNMSQFVFGSMAGASEKIWQNYFITVVISIPTWFLNFPDRFSIDGPQTTLRSWRVDVACRRRCSAMTKLRLRIRTVPTLLQHAATEWMACLRWTAAASQAAIRRWMALSPPLAISFAAHHHLLKDPFLFGRAKSDRTRKKT
jgi:hypothetical protein